MSALVFETDPDKEHRLILLAKTRDGASLWEVGARLLRISETGDWKRVTAGGPYETFAEYLREGCGLPQATARNYMNAAELPLTATLRYGIMGAAMLSAMVALTPEEETPEQALELQVEADDGTTKRFAELTYDERLRALGRLREESDVVLPGQKKVSPARQATNALRDRVRAASAPVLKHAQVTARVVGENGFLDLKAVPLDKAAELFEALAKELEERA